MTGIDRVLVPLPTGQWLALPLEDFSKALRAGAEAISDPAPSTAPEAGDAEPLLDADQLASALALPATWIAQAARERRIPSVQAGRWRRFRRSAVERALAASGHRQ